MRLLWTDIETTGLDPTREEVLEVAVYDADIAAPFDARLVLHEVLHYPKEAQCRLDPFILDMHTKSGLLDECASSSRTIDDVRASFLALLPSTVNGDQRPVLAGSTVHFDRSFLQARMPDVCLRLSHRHYDVSSLKLQCSSLGMGDLKKAEAHRSQADVLESIDHGRRCVAWLRDNLSPSPEFVVNRAKTRLDDLRRCPEMFAYSKESFVVQVSLCLEFASLRAHARFAALEPTFLGSKVGASINTTSMVDGLVTVWARDVVDHALNILNEELR